MTVWLRACAGMTLGVLVAGCSSDGPAGTLPTCEGGTDATKRPITDLGTGCYLQYRGGLYPNGENALSGAHLAAGLAAAAQIAPLDVAGQPSASGKYVLVSIGMSNTTQEFCNDGQQVGTCLPPGFVASAASDAAVNHTTLAIVNGAAGGRAASSWVSATSAEYDRIRDTWLTPLGLSEAQVQIGWVKVANPGPTASLPAANADAFALLTSIGQIARAMKTRYPNLRQIFISSRIYAGYATTPLNPEPYAYESAFSVKWAIESQIAQMAGGAADARAGDLRYDTSVASWLGWGPYLWADGTNARSDGLTWVVSDFSPSDGTHPAMSAREKVAGMLLTFFKTSPAASCWFLAGQTCQP
ncbi:MAG TPA: hypothetical protein VF973_07825 [Myxococcales bacterium]